MTRFFIALVTLLGVLLVGCAPSTYNVPSQVDASLWRSGQPTTRAQWIAIRDLGIEHVLKLNFESEGSDADATAVGLDVHVLSIQPEGDQDVFDNLTNTFVQPSEATLNEVEQLLDSGGIWLIHCTFGHDRTGLAVGRHRVRHDGWTKEAAYAEMLRLGFHAELHGLHESWEQFRP